MSTQDLHVVLLMLVFLLVIVLLGSPKWRELIDKGEVDPNLPLVMHILGCALMGTIIFTAIMIWAVIVGAIMLVLLAILIYKLLPDEEPKTVDPGLDARTQRLLDFYEGINQASDAELDNFFKHVDRRR